MTDHFTRNKKHKIKFNSKLLFFAISGIFLLFVSNGILHQNLNSSLIALSPLFPLPLIAIIILFSTNNDLEFTLNQLSVFAQISIIFAFLLYIFLSIFFDKESVFYQYHAGRLTLFSGNPIPFSFVTLGLSIFCLAGWRISGPKFRIVAIICFLLGIYLSSFLSGTRSSLLSILLILPLIISYLSSNISRTVILSVTITLCILTVIYIHTANVISNSYFTHIENGLKTLFLKDRVETSIALRWDMWSASLKAISDAPFLGSNITERFNAIMPFLPKEFPYRFSHPHNDIFASIISAGVFGGVLAIFSLCSPIFAALLEDEIDKEKLYFGAMITIISLCTANFSTVFFNDISAAWLAFSTYLIWQTNFLKNI